MLVIPKLFPHMFTFSPVIFLFREIVAFHHEARSRMPFSFGVLGFLWSAPKRKTSGWSQDRGWDSSHFFFVIGKKGSRRAKEQSFLFGVLPFNPAPDYDCHAPSGHMGMPGSAGNMVAGREALGMLLTVCQRVALFARVIRVIRVLSQD